MTRKNVKEVYLISLVTWNCFTRPRYTSNRFSDDASDLEAGVSLCTARAAILLFKRCFCYAMLAGTVAAFSFIIPGSLVNTRSVCIVYLYQFFNLKITLGVLIASFGAMFCSLCCFLLYYWLLCYTINSYLMQRVVVGYESRFSFVKMCYV